MHVHFLEECGWKEFSKLVILPLNKFFNTFRADGTFLNIEKEKVAPRGQSSFALVGFVSETIRTAVKASPHSLFGIFLTESSKGLYASPLHSAKLSGLLHGAVNLHTAGLIFFF